MKADLNRHREKQAELEFKIAEIESKSALNESDEVYLRAYRALLCKLLQSKAELTEKVGKKW